MCQVRNAENVHERMGTLVVDLLILLVVGDRKAPGGAAHRVEDRLGRHNLSPHRRGGQPHARRNLGRISIQQIGF